MVKPPIGIYVPWLPHLSLIDGILHLECNVLPLCDNVAVMPEIAVAMAIL